MAIALGPEREELVAAFTEERLQAWYLRRMERRTARAISCLSLDEAYEVQQRFLSARTEAGETLIGWKVGCTSPAIRDQFRLDQPICGRLLDRHIYRSGDAVDSRGFVDCAVEAEFALLLRRELLLEELPRKLYDLVEAVVPGIELHNYRFWYGDPTSQELISSNGIHAALVVGGSRKLLPAESLDGEIVELYVNGQLRASGRGSDIMGGVLRSLEWLTAQAGAHGWRIPAGQLVIPGSAVSLVRIGPGDSVVARFSTAGECRLQLV